MEPPANRRKRSGEFLRRYPGAAVAAATFVVFALNFNAYRVFGDGEVPYAFLERLFGNSTDPIGYQFGLAFLNAPFYGLGRLAGSLGLADIQGAAVEPAMISLASNAYVLAAGAIAVAILVSLGLPLPGFVVFAAVFGTPVFYYGVFSPAYTHAGDTFLMTAAVALLLLWFRRPDHGLAIALWLGAVLGFAMTIRYFNGAVLLAIVAGFLWLRQTRHAAAVAVAASTTFGLLVLVPVALGVPIFSAPGYSPEAAIQVTPLGPLKMLFSEHRGLFVWSPVTLLALAGYVRLAVRRPDLRPFLTLAGSMGVALLASYSLVSFWDGGWSFSQRYLTSLFPLVAIGLGGLLAELRRAPIVAIASVAVAWSVFLGLNHVFGALQSDGAFDIAAKVLNGERSVSEFLELFRAYSRLRYVL